MFFPSFVEFQLSCSYKSRFFIRHRFGIFTRPNKI